MRILQAHIYLALVYLCYVILYHICIYIGIVLFELCALELPFQAQSLPALVHRICTTDPPYNKVEPHYSAALVDIVSIRTHE